MPAAQSAYCSFCRKSHTDVGPLVEGPPLTSKPHNVYICHECIELCQSIVDQERWRRLSPDPSSILQQIGDRVIETVESSSLTFDRDIGQVLDQRGRVGAEAFKFVSEV